MKDAADFLIKNYYTHPWTCAREKLLLRLEVHRDRVIQVVRNGELVGVAVFALMNDENTIISEDNLDEVLYQNGTYLHFLMVSAKGFGIIREGLRRVLASHEVKSVCWWDDDKLILHRYTPKKPFDQVYFRELTKRVFAAEKPGFWSDWTPEQQQSYESGDWKAFSRSRGYTEAEITECAEWQGMIAKHGRWILNCVQDLCLAQAQKNLALDTRGEILKSTRAPAQVRGDMMKLEKAINQHSEHKSAKDFPLKHTFTDGQYIRESFVPAGYLFTTRIHKVDHPMFIMSGDVSILTDDGFKRVKAPFHTITKRGTKRVVLTHEDTVCITVHPTQSKTVEEAEKELWADNFEEVGLACDMGLEAIGRAK